MTDASSLTQIHGQARTYFRRAHKKADGRDLFVYGYQPHQDPAQPELLRPAAQPGELRRDPLRGTWSVYAPHRQNRTFQPKRANDPLAPAKEGSPETEIPFRSFELAVFENRFPSLSSSTGPLSDWATDQAIGHCDVVVYTQAPTGDLNTIGQDRRILLIEALIDRYKALYDAGHAYVMPFENRGQQVGVTLPHPHGQIYAFPDVPGPQAAAAKAFSEGYDLVADHRSWRGEFDIAEDGNTVAFCPPYARFPYETWIMPKTPCAGPWDLDRSGVEELARLLGDVPRRLDALFGETTPYMMSFQAAPPKATAFQFSVQFYPILRAPERLKYLASVEQFTGIFTVDVVPEIAAAALRAL